MSPPKIRVLFVAVGVGLLLQYAAVGLFGVYGAEPWPAVVLPGFKSVYDEGEAIRVERPVISAVFADGERVPVAPSRLLAPLPRSHHPSFLQAQCRPASLSGTLDSERCRTPAGRRWFFERAAAVFPERSVQTVTVTWVQVRLDPSSGRTLTHPLDSLSLSPPSDVDAAEGRFSVPRLDASAAVAPPRSPTGASARTGP